MKKSHLQKSLIMFFTLICIFSYNVKDVLALNKAPYINARSAIAIDRDTGVVLYERNAYEVIPMASTTKIMTSIVALKHGNLDEKFIISKRAATVRGSRVKYRSGEEITLRELLYGLMFKSGNDAAIAIAEGIGGSVEEFAKLMNEEAARIGVTNSHFETPHGLDKEHHYTNAYDLALITAEAKKSKVFREICSSKEIKKEKHKFTRDYNNINKLLYSIPSCTGVKTGYTGLAGKCLVSSFKIGEKEIIVVTLNCPQRWGESKKLYEYVKDTYDYETLKKKNDVLGDMWDIRGNKIPLILKEDVLVPIKKGEQYKEVIDIKKNNFKDCNVKKGSMVGYYKVLSHDKVIYKKPIYNSKDILNKEGTMHKLKKMFK